MEQNIKKNTIYQFADDLFKDSPYCILVLNALGRIYYSNPVFKSTFDSLLLSDNQEFNDLGIIRDTKFEDYVKLLDRSKKNVQFELNFTDPVYEETQWFNVSLNKVKINGEPLYLMQLIETTDQKLFEDEFSRLNMEINTQNLEYLAKSNKVSRVNRALKQREMELIVDKKAAEEANRLKSIFLANMSHEIRTPMNVILGYARLLIKYIKDEIAIEQLNVIQQSGKGLLALINNILDLSKIEAGKFQLNEQPTNLENLFNEVENLFILKANEKGIKFTLHYPKDIPKNLIIDETQFRQIIINLVENSIKFTNEGFVEVSLAYKKDEITKLVDLNMTVKDSGIGISNKQIERIFQPFTQEEGIETKFGGTGLGLTITQKIIQMMGGEIFVESRVDEGTSFYINIPEIHEGGGIIGTSKRSELINLEFSEYKILIVEDEFYSRDILKKFLEQNNQHVIEAKNGIEAVQKVKKLNNISLVLMDMRMPDMNGYEATRLIRKIKPKEELPIVAITAEVFKEEREEMIRSGCNGFIGKPFEEIDLLDVLTKYLPSKVSKSEKTINDSLKSSDFEIQNPELEKALYELSQTFFKDAQDSMQLDKWQTFADEIVKIGKHYQQEELTNFGKTFETTLKNFDIKMLQKLINQFKKALEKE